MKCEYEYMLSISLDDFGCSRDGAGFDLPDDWQQIALRKYLSIAREVARKQSAYADLCAPSRAAKLRDLSARNASIRTFSPISDIEPDCVGAYNSGGRSYRVMLSAQPDYSRSHMSWELQMEHSNRILRGYSFFSSAKPDADGVLRFHTV